MFHIPNLHALLCINAKHMVRYIEHVFLLYIYTCIMRVYADIHVSLGVNIGPSQ